MERLSFTEGEPYNGLEASIHLARYAFAQPLCQGRAVLDMACGEGYGSRLLANWGARSVVGVDVSAEAVDQARRLFGSPQVTYRVGAAEALVGMFAPESFDLIVSLETIEHVPDPEGLLRSFRRLLAPGGAIVVSCPNDWWYYPSAQERNPYHLRKYTFDEFQQLSEQVLGPARAWFFGAPIAGFGNTQVAGLAQASSSDTQGVMLGALNLPGALTLPAEAQRGPNASNVSYFLGVWCAEADAPPAGAWHGAALLPASMDALLQGFFGQLASQTEVLRRELEDAKRMIASGESKGMMGEIGGMSLDSLLAEGDGASEESMRGMVAANPLAERAMAELRVQITELRNQHKDALDNDEAIRITRQQLEIERAMARSMARQHEEQLRQEREALARCRQEAEQAQQNHEATEQSYQQLKTHAQVLELEAQRYRRLRDLFPAGLRRRLMPLVRRVLSVVRRIVR